MPNKEEIELEVFKFYSQRLLDVKNNAPGLNESNFQRILFPLLENYDALGLRHIFKVVGKEETIHKYPKDWWNMFKERWFPTWLKSRFPVRKKVVKAVHLFPYSQLDLGQEVTKIKIKDKIEEEL